MKSDQLAIYILFGIAVFFLLVYIVRLIFSIPAIVRHLNAIANLLALQAKNNGVPEEEVGRVLEETLDESEIK